MTLLLLTAILLAVLMPLWALGMIGLIELGARMGVFER